MLNYQRVQYFIIVMLSGFGLFLSRIDLVVLRLVWSVRTALKASTVAVFLQVKWFIPCILMHFDSNCNPLTEVCMCDNLHPTTSMKGSSMNSSEEINMPTLPVQLLAQNTQFQGPVLPASLQRTGDQFGLALTSLLSRFSPVIDIIDGHAIAFYHILIHIFFFQL